MAMVCLLVNLGSQPDLDSFSIILATAIRTCAALPDGVVQRYSYQTYVLRREQPAHVPYSLFSFILFAASDLNATLVRDLGPSRNEKYLFFENSIR